MHRPFPVLVVRMLAARTLAVALALAPHAVAVAQAPAAPLTPAQVREDLQQLRRVLLEVEKSWTDPTWAVGVARLDALVAAADTISPAALAVGVARVVATSDNAHSGVPTSLVADRFGRVPVRMVPFGADFHVLRATQSSADLLGARLLAIDGHPLRALREAAHTMTAGPPARRDRFVPDIVESPELLHALGLARAKDAASYRFELSDGRVVERRLVAEPPSPQRPRGPSSTWMMAPVEDPDAWPALRNADQAPWSLRESARSFRLRAAPELGALVIEMRRNWQQAGELVAFMDSVRTEIARVAPRHLIVDLRMNGGGNLQITRDFMRELPAKVPGRLFVLTSPWTFSAAISSASYLKQAAPERVVIVGEEAGDRMMFFAEGGPTTLQHSRLLIGTATQRHDYADGCRQFTDCHGPVVRFPISVPSLAPQIAAPWTIKAYLEGRDPSMDAIAAVLTRQP